MTEEEFRLQVVGGLSALKATVETEMSHIKDDISEIKGDVKQVRSEAQETRRIADNPPCIPCKEKADCHMEAVEATVSNNRKLVYILIVATLTVAVRVVWSSYGDHQVIEGPKASTAKKTK